jgi:CHAD domain-containing protein
MGRAEYVSFHQHVRKKRKKAAMTGAAGRGNSGLGDNSFGDGLTTAARSIIADAHRALADHALSDADTVHEVRKALKRWRALLRLLARPLGAQADQMRSEARELMRTLAGARDAQSALDALNDLRKITDELDTPLSAASMATIQKRLIDIRHTAEQTSFTPDMRDRLMQYLDFATLSLERWPLPAIDFDTVADGLIATYRRVRQLIPEDWRGADPEHLHDLRRRVVEYRHQIDLIAPLWPRLGQMWVEEAQRLRSRLGACQDLAMLSNFTAPRQPLAPWRSRLANMIDARRAAHLKTAERLANRLFAEKPKAFRRGIAALSAARAARK